MSNPFLSHIRLRAFRWPGCFLEAKNSSRVEQSLVNPGLLRPDLLIQFNTFVKKAAFAALPGWPVAHSGDTGHWALGQLHWVTPPKAVTKCWPGWFS